MKGLRAKDSLLTGTILKYCILFLIIILVGACHSPGKDKLQSGKSFGKIIYDTYVINRDSTDSWGDECLSKFSRKKLVDKIFTAVFDGKVTPYDYFTGEKISPEQIRKMETERQFSRENISKIQFEEQWIWDDEKNELLKQVISMTIAYEVFDNIGKSRGQKSIFKLKFR
ncbi:MAG TPA: hypothetical protein VFC67_04105 [Prolixibacteraceae bacterium]|nr:hypothetical protein [Prolixibacteraceae bacterium]